MMIVIGHVIVKRGGRGIQLRLHPHVIEEMRAIMVVVLVKFNQFVADGATLHSAREVGALVGCKTEVNL